MDRGNPYVVSWVKPLPVLETLTECVNRISQGKANAAIFRWFGTLDPNDIGVIRDKTMKMKTQFNLQSIDIGFSALARRNRNENASAANNIASQLNPRILEGLAANDERLGFFPIEINEGFARLPKFLPKLANGIVSLAAPGQSQLNTILHELSHAIIGTEDEQLAHGQTAYTARNARDLANRFPRRAQNNAENWGIFIEAVGHHKSS